MIACDLLAVGLRGVGLPGWRESVPILAGRAPWVEAPLSLPKDGLLPAGERRRASTLTRLVMLAAEEAMTAGAVDPATLRSVFASSSGDMDVIDKICSCLLQSDRPVSPTHFHNSVHNAPAGYWGLATGCMEASLSLSAYDFSFARGLLEAGATLEVDAATVLLVAYDAPPPPPLAESRRITTPFAVAMLLAPVGAPSAMARLRIGLGDDGDEDRLDGRWEEMRTGNPAARSLPLLRALATGTASVVRLPWAPGRRRLRVEATR